MPCTVVNSQAQTQARLPSLPSSMPGVPQGAWTSFLQTLNAWAQILQQESHAPNVLPAQFQTFAANAATPVLAAFTAANCTPSIDATTQYYGGASLKVAIAAAGATLSFTGTPISIAAASRWFAAFSVLATGGCTGSLTVKTASTTITESFDVPAGTGWQQVWGLFDLRAIADTQATWELTFTSTATVWLDGLQMNLIGSPISKLPKFAGTQMVTGGLAYADAVDLATNQVLNKTATNITYTGGATVQSLQPAQAGADVTAQNTAAAIANQGALATANNVDLSTSQVTNVNQSTGRAWLSPVDVPTVVTGEFVANPPQGAYQGSPVNGTARQQPTPFAFAFNATVDGGIVEILCQIAQNWGYGYMFRVDGRAGNYVGQILRMDNGTWTNIGTQHQSQNAAALNETVGVVAMVGLYGLLEIYVNGALYCSAIDTTYTPNGSMYMGWEVVGNPTISPPTAQALTIDFPLDGNIYGRFPIAHFDGLGTRRIATINGAVSPLGSIVTGSSTITLSYTSTSSSITISWTAGTINRMDGSQTTVSSGSVTVTGLSASTTYYAAAYWDEVAQTVNFVTGQSGAVGSPAILYASESAAVAWQAQLQARLNLGWVPVGTAASGGTGGGNGSSGCCLRGAQLIELASGVMREAQELTTGDVLSSPDGPIRITQLRFEPWAQWYRVEFNDGRILEVAPDHRFMDPSGVQIHARDLRLQTIVEARNCYLSVARLELCTDRDIKVGIEVEEPHVYYVDGVLSHNKVYC